MKFQKMFTIFALTFITQMAGATWVASGPLIIRNHVCQVSITQADMAYEISGIGPHFTSVTGNVFQNKAKLLEDKRRLRRLQVNPEGKVNKTIGISNSCVSTDYSRLPSVPLKAAKKSLLPLKGGGWLDLCWMSSTGTEGLFVDRDLTGDSSVELEPQMKKWEASTRFIFLARREDPRHKGYIYLGTDSIVFEKILTGEEELQETVGDLVFKISCGYEGSVDLGAKI